LPFFIFIKQMSKYQYHSSKRLVKELIRRIFFTKILIKLRNFRPQKLRILNSDDLVKSQRSKPGSKFTRGEEGHPLNNSVCQTEWLRRRRVPARIGRLDGRNWKIEPRNRDPGVDRRERILEAGIDEFQAVRHHPFGDRHGGHVSSPSTRAIRSLSRGAKSPARRRT
jgi:hypothetical protein